MSDQVQTPTALSDESFADLFESSQSLVKEGQVVTGTVLSVDPEFVLVDVGCKSEGMIATWEFADDDGVARIEVARRSKSSSSSPRTKTA
jgi:small subunit ribosomal protein S1